MRLAMILTFGALLSGCATHWSAPGGKTYQDFVTARYECLKEVQPTVEGSANAYGASVSSRPSCGELVACMNAKGFFKSSDGPFVAQQSVRCNN